MKAVTRALAILCLLCATSFGQVVMGSYKFTASAPQGAAVHITQGSFSGMTYFKLIWAPNGLNSCSLAIDTSVDGSVWSLGALVANQGCSSNSSFTTSSAVAGNVNYIRVRGSISGGGSVAVTLLGYQAAPLEVTTPNFYLGGTLTNAVKVYTGTQALTAGSATHTFANSFSFTGTGTFNCWATDTSGTAAAANATPASSTTVTVKGSGTDTIALLCIGT